MHALFDNLFFFCLHKKLLQNIDRKIYSNDKHLYELRMNIKYKLISW